MPVSPSIASGRNAPEASRHSPSLDPEQDGFDRPSMPRLPNPDQLPLRNMRRVCCKVTTRIALRTAQHMAAVCGIVIPFFLRDRVEQRYVYHPLDIDQRNPIGIQDHVIKTTYLQKVVHMLPSSILCGVAMGILQSLHEIGNNGVNAYEDQKLTKIRSDLVALTRSPDTSFLAKSISEQVMRATEQTQLYHPKFSEYASEMVEYVRNISEGADEPGTDRITEGEYMALGKTMTELYRISRTAI